MSSPTEYPGASAPGRPPVAGPAYPGPGRTFSETKNGLKTSEFYVMLVFVVAVLLATYLDEDSLSRQDGWRFAAFAVVAYVISRGLAKLGVREPYDEAG